MHLFETIRFTTMERFFHKMWKLVFSISALCLACMEATVIQKRQLLNLFPDIFNLGVCREALSFLTIPSLLQLATDNVLPASEYIKSIEKVMAQVPYRPESVSGQNAKSMSQLYRFAMYAGLSYCNSQAEMQNVAKSASSGSKMLYIGNFTMKAVRDVPGHPSLFTQSEGNRYIIAVDHGVKQVIVSWRGSNNLNNVITDANGLLVNQLDSQLYPMNNARSAKPQNAQAFQGFLESLPRETLASFDSDVEKVTRENPNYQLVITGHSMGGAQAIHAAMHWHLTQKQPRISGIYTYGMPITGNTAWNDWVTSELSSYNWVRTVSRGDIVAWARVSDPQFKNSNNLDEVFLPMSNQPIQSPTICKGQFDNRCSASIPCAQKQWNDHVWYAGININPLQFCVLGQN